MARTKDFNYVTGKKYDGMMGRCYRPNDGSYEDYGGRGIKVCSVWIKDISEFRAWVVKELLLLNITIEHFVANSRSLQLDRIDTNGHYTPENCRFVGAQLNMRNRRAAVVGRVAIESAEGEKIQF